METDSCQRDTAETTGVQTEYHRVQAGEEID